MSKIHDPRDFTKDPPAELDVHSVIRNRERARQYLTTGEFNFPRGHDWIALRDWVKVP